MTWGAGSLRHRRPEELPGGAKVAVPLPPPAPLNVICVTVVLCASGAMRSCDGRVCARERDEEREADGQAGIRSALEGRVSFPVCLLDRREMLETAPVP